MFGLGRNIIRKHKMTTHLVLFCLTLVALTACGPQQIKPSVTNPETTATQKSYNHTMVYSGNGYKRYRMSAPEILRYELAAEPTTVYPQGVKVETFEDSTLNGVSSDLRADYAIYNEKKKLWTAKGNVVANNYKGRKHMETELLYWDEATGKIYNDCRTVVWDNESTYAGIGFETDQGFDTWSFNRAGGRMSVEQQDSTAVDSQARPLLRRPPRPRAPQHRAPCRLRLRKPSLKPCLKNRIKSPWRRAERRIRISIPNRN